MADYRVPPSLSYLPACEAEPMSNTPDTTENDEEKQEDLEDLEKPESNGTEFEDCKNDRSEDELCEPKVKGLYENDWFTGTIQYSNEKMGRYRVLYDDNSKDYIGIEEIEGVELVLLDQLYLLKSFVGTLIRIFYCFCSVIKLLRACTKCLCNSPRPLFIVLLRILDFFTLQYLKKKFSIRIS